MTRKVKPMIDDLHGRESERGGEGRDAGGPSRRGFIGGTGLFAVGAVAGGFLAGPGLAPPALAQASPGGGGAAPAGPQRLDFPGKDAGLSLLGDRPLVAETPEHLLDDDTTPVGRFYIRNNGQVPDEAKDAAAWTLTVDGEVASPLKITLAELKSRFSPRTLRMVMECGGNGRSAFQPPARGNPWTNGGVGCAEWTGVPLSDVLQAAGLKSSAVFTGHYGADPHLSGEPGKDALSRGVPIAKAMEPHTLLVWAMNGQPLTHIHGAPLRLIVPGWPGSVSAKWLTRIWVREREHDGQGMGGTSYRIPVSPIVPGTNADGKANFRNLEAMPTRSIITSPANGARSAAGTRELALRGAAWGGENEVREVHVSADGGQSWTPMAVQPQRNRYDWHRWTGAVRLPADGYYELWVRATDARGLMQPHVAQNWNPQGYGANPMHRVAVLVG